MKLLILALLVTLSSITHGQGYANWKTGNETYVTSYQVMQSADTVNWISIKTIIPLKLPDSNWYSYILPSGTYYYKIIANTIAGKFATVSALNALTSVNIMTATIKTHWFTDSLSWITVNEKNVNYYLIEKTTGSTWSVVIKVIAKGNSNYTYVNSRSWFSRKPTYRITPAYINGATGSALTFK